MRKSSVFSMLLGSVLSLSSYADISRSEFIDQLDSANCSQVPPEIYLDTDSQHYDFANALSLSWVSLAALSDNVLSTEDFEQQWHITNMEFIKNEDSGLKVMIADYQDTTLVTFHYADKEPKQESDEFTGANLSFSLGEETHKDFTQTLKAEWQTLLNILTPRLDANKKLWLFGEGLGGAFAQLSAPGFETEGLYIDKVYLSNAPVVGSQDWINKTNDLLDGKVHSSAYEKKPSHAPSNYGNPVNYIQDLSGLISGNREQYLIQGEDGYHCTLINILENQS